jgi:hypothetical protein
MLLCDKTAYQWRGDDTPRPVAEDIIQVGVGRDASYVLTSGGRLLTWEDDLDERQEIFDRVVWFAAGRSGVFMTLTDGAFIYMARPKSWFGEGDLVMPVKVSASVMTANSMVTESLNHPTLSFLLQAR